MRSAVAALLSRPLLLLALAAALPAPARAADWITHSSNDFAGVGLLQNPSARMDADGEFKFGVSSVYPYNNLHASLQLLPWLETALRYTDTVNRPYGAESFSGDQSNKDRGIDFKIRLVDEADGWPEIALGFRDVGGTGLFSSEYLVASRQWGDVDLTLGLGWGRLGTRGGIRNPFAALSDSFETRPGEGTVDEETVGYERWFAGEEIGVFGGLEWQTPIDALTVKLEYDGNDYQSEALSNPQDVDSPLNLALNYRVARRFDLGLGYERGNTLMFRASARTNWNQWFGPHKSRNPPSTAVQANVQPVPFFSVRQQPEASTQWVALLRAELQRQSVTVRALDVEEEAGRITLWYSQALARDGRDALLRIAEAMELICPDRYQQFVLIAGNEDVEHSRVDVRRGDIARELSLRIQAEDLLQRMSFESPLQDGGAARAEHVFAPGYPDVDVDLAPGLRQHVGGPDDFYFAQLWWRSSARVTLTDRWFVGGTLGFDLYNNFDGLKHRDASALPHVRSDIVKYIKQGENGLVSLESNYIWSPAPSWYARLSAGYFETMYGGVAGELLYRRPYAPWAVGVNLNRVRKREYDQTFDFRQYEATTGHLTGYFELPWYQLRLTTSAGVYLARDVGVTVELGREFANGMVAGVFATRTDVPAEEFGEGSFDRGFYLSVPLDLFLARSSPRTLGFVFRPLTRDGGQKVRDGVGLYGWTRGKSLSPDDDWYQDDP